MKKLTVLLFGLFLAVAFVVPGVVTAADIEFGPPDIVSQVDMEDVLMDLSNPAEKGALSFDTYQLQSCLGCTKIGTSPHALISFSIAPPALIGFSIAPPALIGHLGGVHSSPFG